MQMEQYLTLIGGVIHMSQRQVSRQVQGGMLDKPGQECSKAAGSRMTRGHITLEMSLVDCLSLNWQELHKWYEIASIRSFRRHLQSSHLDRHLRCLQPCRRVDGFQVSLLDMDTLIPTS